ncbi:MAG TPA: DUF1858 domain-containing protein [Candidatus Ozemobacteraceae bacterium]|nr:DUF1858 domain-containing protein [Candidatus Ozemobacteraceae bacterium]
MAEQITSDMLIGDLLRARPEAAQILMQFGMHCLGCSVAAGESLGQAADAHGIAIEKLLSALNAK